MNPQFKQSEYISTVQLFLLIHIFQIGTTIVIGVGGEAKQDTWFVILVASMIGVALVFVYDQVLRLSSGSCFNDALTLLFGNKVGKLIIFLYVTYFTYQAARILRDFCEILNTAVYPNTPTELVAILFVITIMYYQYHGLEVSARSLIVFMPYLCLALFLTILLLGINQSIHIDQVRPVLANGLNPILSALYPHPMTFPFGEIIVFPFLMSYLQKRQIFLKTSIGAVLVSGVVISFFSMIIVTVLGRDYAESVNFPLLSAVRSISIADFIERLDALVVFTLLIGVFFKVLLFSFAGLKGIEYISSIPYRFFIMPFGGITVLFSILVADNFADHMIEGTKVIPYYLHLPLQYGIPILLFIGLWTKKKLKGVSKK